VGFHSRVGSAVGVLNARALGVEISRAAVVALPVVCSRGPGTCGRSGLYGARSLIAGSYPWSAGPTCVAFAGPHTEDVSDAIGALL
jgi:hypothetical protein